MVLLQLVDSYILAFEQNRFINILLILFNQNLILQSSGNAEIVELGFLFIDIKIDLVATKIKF